MKRRDDEDKRRRDAEIAAHRIVVLEDAISTPSLKPVAVWEAETKVLERIQALQISIEVAPTLLPYGVDPRTNPAIARKKRQILLRQSQRDHNQRVFDLDESLRNSLLYAPASQRKLINLHPSKNIIAFLRRATTATPLERPPEIWTCSRTLPFDQVVAETRSKYKDRLDDEFDVLDDEGGDGSKKSELSKKRKRIVEEDEATQNPAKRKKPTAGTTGSGASSSSSSKGQTNRHRAGYSNEENTSSAEMETHLWRTMKGQGAGASVLNYRAGEPITFYERLFGDVFDRCGTTLIKSPWSGKSIKPYIRRDDISNAYQLSESESFESRSRPQVPQRVLMQQELLLRRNLLLDEHYRLPPQSIDYCYLRPEHVEQVNNLLCETFWPGIDISESLVYPEHTVVVMLRKFVIGCGFIAPNGYITYICLRPEWQNYGIGSFMLYHLIQTCHGRDITLHVSATNHAMLLYQKFCFKVEEFIKNFYDKYLPEDSPQCKHAYFLRLRR